MMLKEELKGRLEALLFASGDPISITEASFMLGIVPDACEEVTEELIRDYSSPSRGIFIIRTEDRIRLSTKPELSDTVKKLGQVNERQTLGKGALECLAVIAYKQPVTRVEIDEIRGVSSEYVLSKLTDAGLIEIIGRKDVPGRPRLYGTSEEFLLQFGFRDLKKFREDEEYKILMDKLSQEDEFTDELSDEDDINTESDGVSAFIEMDETSENEE